MIDWFVLVAALPLLPIVALLYFVGCTSFGTDSTPAPGGGGAGGAGAPPPGGSGAPPPSPPAAPPAPPPSLLEVDLASDLNVIKPGGTNDQAESVLVTWTLAKTTGGPVDQPLDETIVRADSTRAFLNPALDPAAIRVLTDDLPASQVGLYDRVRCKAVVTTRPSAGGPAATSTSPEVTVALAPNQWLLFQLSPKWDNLTARPRQFNLAVVPAAGPGTVAVPPTRLQVNPAKDINDIAPGGTPYKVVSIKVTWTLSKSSGPVATTLDETIVRIDAARPFLDPALDPASIWDLSSAQALLYGVATCVCQVTMRPTDLTNPATAVATTTPVSLVIAPGQNHVVQLLANWDNPKATPRKFTLIVQP